MNVTYVCLCVYGNLLFYYDDLQTVLQLAASLSSFKRTQHQSLQKRKLYFMNTSSQNDIRRIPSIVPIFIMRVFIM